MQFTIINEIDNKNIRNCVIFFQRWSGADMKGLNTLSDIVLLPLN